MGDERVFVAVLGQITVWAVDPANNPAQRRKLSIGGPKPRLLIGLLAAATSAGLSDDALTDALWLDSDRGEASRDRRSSLQAYISRIRKVLRPLGADVVRTNGAYSLAVGAGTIDLHDFEDAVDALSPAGGSDALQAADAALDLWQGSPFGDLGDHPALLADRARLQERHAICRAFRVDRLLERNNNQDAVLAATDDARAHPFAERPVAQLAVALHRLGRQADAIDVIDTLISRLRNELGMDPSRDIRELQTAILDHDPRLDAPKADASVLRAGQPAPRTSSLNGPAIGRDIQLAQLQSAIASRASALVVGPPGCGKSTLIGSLDHVVIGACQDTDQAPPYWPWPAVIDGLRQSTAGSSSPPLDHTQSVFEVSLAVASVIRSVAQDHASDIKAVVIEDVHWASPETLQLHSFLQRELATWPLEERLTLIVTSRPVVEANAAQVAFASAASDVVRVGPLNAAQVEAMLTSRLTVSPGAPVVATVMAKTGGVPLLVRRAAEDLAAGAGLRTSEVASARSNLVMTWLDQASESDLVVAAYATIFRSDFDTALVHAATGFADAPSTLRALQRLSSLGILDSHQGDRWSFVHALVRDELKPHLDPEAANQAHHRLVECYRTQPQLAEATDQILHHLRGSGALADSEDVMNTALEIADAARRSGVLDRAEFALGVAVDAARNVDMDEQQRFDLLLVGAEVAWEAGSASAARDMFHEASEMLATDDPRRADIAASYAGFGMTHVEVDPRGRQLLHRSLTLVDPSTAVGLRCRSRLLIAEWDPDSISTQADALVEEAQALGDKHALAWTLGSRLVSSMTMHSMQQRSIDAQNLLSLGRELHDDGATGLGLAHRADAAAARGDLIAAATDIDRLGTLAAATGRPAHQWFHEHYLGALRCAQGRFEEGEALFTHAFEVGAASQGAAALEAFSGALFMTRSAQQRELELLPLLETGANPGGNERPTGLDAWMLGRAYVLARAGRVDEARPVLAQMTELAKQISVERVHSIEVSVLLLTGHLLHETDALESGFALLEPFEDHFCVAPGMISSGAAQVYLGLAAHGLGRTSEGKERVRAGIEANERAGLLAWAKRGRTVLDALVTAGR